MKNEKIAIDLTWVRVGKVGGTESYVRNLLTGMGELGRENFTALLLLAADNFSSFKKYGRYKCFRLVRCNTASASQVQRILWQNMHLPRTLRLLGIRKCFEPVYSVPFLPAPGIRFYTVIHDLQALHYPEYCGKIREIWMRMSWKNAVKKSERLISISRFVMDDINSTYSMAARKNRVIYNPVAVSHGCGNDEAVMEKYGLHNNSYYYTVSSLLPHKNLITLIKMLGILKKKDSDLFYPLAVSGIEYHAEGEIGDLRQQVKDEISNAIGEEGLSGYIIFTGFVSNSERDALYRNCRAFLFPSVFEGFGMPPVEAIGYGKPVLAACEASVPEITGGLADYVSNPFDPEEYVKKLEEGLRVPSEEMAGKLLKRYVRKAVAAQYLEVFGAEGKPEI